WADGAAGRGRLPPDAGGVRRVRRPRRGRGAGPETGAARRVGDGGAGGGRAGRGAPEAGGPRTRGAAGSGVPDPAGDPPQRDHRRPALPLTASDQVLAGGPARLPPGPDRPLQESALSPGSPPARRLLALGSRDRPRLSPCARGKCACAIAAVPDRPRRSPFWRGFAPLQEGVRFSPFFLRTSGKGEGIPRTGETGKGSAEGNKCPPQE